MKKYYIPTATIFMSKNATCVVYYSVEDTLEAARDTIKRRINDSEQTIIATRIITVVEEGNETA